MDNRKEIVEKIKLAVHKPLNWEDYNSSDKRVNTNCLSHAIGSTVTIDSSIYRLGMISERREFKYTFKSREELKEFFLSDMKVLELETEEIPFIDKATFLKDMEQMQLDYNQYIVALFVKVNERGGTESILDFHFIRYDQNKGWSEKRVNNYVNVFYNISVQWPSSWNDRLVGVFKITR